MRTILGLIGGFLTIMIVGITFFFMQMDNSNSNTTTQAMTTSIQAAAVKSMNEDERTEHSKNKKVIFKSLNEFMSNYFSDVNESSKAKLKEDSSNTSFDFYLETNDEVKIINGKQSSSRIDLTTPQSVKMIKIHFTDSKGIDYDATSALTGASKSNENAPKILDTPVFSVPANTDDSKVLSLEPQLNLLYYDFGKNNPNGSSTISSNSDGALITTNVKNDDGANAQSKQNIPKENYKPIITSPKQVTIIAGQDILTDATAQQEGPNGTKGVKVTSSDIDNTISGTYNQLLTAKNEDTGATTNVYRKLVILPDMAVFQIANSSVGTFSVGSGIPSQTTLMSGISATLPYEGSANSLITVSTNAINPDKAGTYTITYQVVSPVSSTYVATVTRTITYQ